MTLAVDHVALEGRLAGVTAMLDPGSVIAICGPNGAGKSTLLQALAGLLRVGGEVTLAGRVMADLSGAERARAIGYLPQVGEVAWDPSVRGLVTLGRLPHADGGDAAAIDDALDALGLASLAQRAVSTLSGGERARALLARVLAGQPQWILADEPLAALDLAHQLALLRHLRAAAAGGVGVVLVVHDLALAMNLADRVLVLDRGKLVADDHPAIALHEDIISRVWGVTARWLGEAGARALVVG